MRKYIQAILYLMLFLPQTIAYATSESSTNEVSYGFEFPYDNAGKLIISNDTSKTIKIKSIEFDANVNITGDPYGDLYQWGMTIDRKTNNDGMTVHYTLTDSNQGVSIDPSQSKSMTYLYDSALGVFSNLGMNPTNVKVSTLGGETIDLPVTGHCIGNQCNDPAPDYRLMGYYTDWSQYDRNYNATDIPVNKVNGISYAFVGYDTSGNVHLLDPWSDAKQLPAIAQIREQYPYMNASLSFGGWTLSYDFSTLAADTNARELFARNAVKAMKQVQFNGIDIDWEYPVANGAPGEPNHYTPEDAQNFVLLLQNLRSELDRQGLIDNTHYELSIAVGAGVDKINAIEDAYPGAWSEVANNIDFLNLMTYDMHGAFDIAQPAPYNVSDFMAAMALDPAQDPNVNNPVLSKYNVTDAVNEYINAGIKPQQIVVGIPAYGRLSNITDVGDSYGLYRPVTGTPAGEYDTASSGDTGMFDYSCIVDSNSCFGNASALLSGLTLVDFNSNSLGQYAKTPWGYNTVKKQFMTYDDEASTAYKANWVKDNKLGGVMFWEFSGDVDSDSSKSLFNSAQKVLSEK